MDPVAKKIQKIRWRRERQEREEWRRREEERRRSVAPTPSPRKAAAGE
jgi:hypothetical protein